MTADPPSRNASPPVSGRLIGVIAGGGVLGALARYQAGRTWPTTGTAFPWTTLTVNVAGCLLMGVLVVLVTVRFPHPLVRPFLGTGVLGGFTTFSTYSVDIHRLLTDGRPGTALSYLGITAVAAVAAAGAGMTLTRRLTVGHR